MPLWRGDTGDHTSYKPEPLSRPISRWHCCAQRQRTCMWSSALQGWSAWQSRCRACSGARGRRPGQHAVRLGYALEEPVGAVPHPPLSLRTPTRLPSDTSSQHALVVPNLLQIPQKPVRCMPQLCAGTAKLQCSASRLESTPPRLNDGPLDLHRREASGGMEGPTSEREARSRP